MPLNKIHAAESPEGDRSLPIGASFAVPSTVLDRMRQQSVLVLGCVVLAILLGGIYVKRGTRTYTAGSLILIQEPKSTSASQGSAGSDPFANSTALENQIEIIRSDRVLGRVVEALADEAQVVFAEEPLLPMELIFGKRPLAPNEEFQDHLLALRDAMRIRRLGLSQLVEVSVVHKDRQVAAELSNRIVDLYIQDRVESAEHEHQRELSLMFDRLEQLRRRAQAAEVTAQTFGMEAMVPDAAARGAGMPAGSTRETIIVNQAKLRELDSASRATRAAYETALQRFAEFSNQSALIGTGIQVISPAAPPTRHSWPRLTPVLVVATLVGLAIGCMIAYLRASYLLPRWLSVTRSS